MKHEISCPFLIYESESGIKVRKLRKTNYHDRLEGDELKINGYEVIVRLITKSDGTGWEYEFRLTDDNSGSLCL